MSRLKLLALAAAFSSCATEVDLGERPQFWNGTNTLTLFLYDGQTGAPIVDADVKIQVGAVTLSATRTDNTYLIAQIPFGTFPIFVKAPNYLDFVASRSFTSNAALNATQPSYNYVTNTALLYPVQAVYRDVTVRVFSGDDGAAVVSGKLVASIDVNAGLSTPIPNLSDQLTGSLGYLPRSVIVDVVNGLATLPKDQLVFGATYRLNVHSAKNAAGEFLTPRLNAQAVTVQAGIGFPNVTIFLGPPAIAPVALSATNEGDDPAARATIAITFPFPVELCSASSNHRWINRTNDGPNVSNDTDDDGRITTPKEENAVTAVLSEGGTVLTLGYAADTEDADDSLFIEFRGIQVQVTGASACTDLTSVRLRDSNSYVSDDLTVRVEEP